MKSTRGQHSTQDHLSERETPNDNVQTPLWLIDRMIAWMDLKDDMNICDPCAGTDNRMIERIIDVYQKKENNSNIISITGNRLNFWAYEIRHERNTRYNLACPCCMDAFPLIGNFFKMEPEEKFDRFIMNPPFSNLGALKFIKHALKMLSENGRIIAVVPNYILDNSDGRKPWLAAHIWRMAMIPKNTFADYGCPVLHGSVIDVRHTGSGYFDYFEPDKGQNLFTGAKKCQ